MISTAPITSFTQAMHPVYLSILGIIILILGIYFIVLILKFYIIKDKPLKRTIVKIGIILICCLIVQTGIHLHYHYTINHEILEYSVIIESISNENEEIIIPISGNNDLIKSIQIKFGSGILNVEDTEYGLGLKINFSSSIKIVGKYESTKGMRDYELTMKNNSDFNRRTTSWIYYKPSNISNYNCSIRLELSRTYFGGVVWEECDSVLRSGWNDYNISWGGMG